jgi:hypothetical protein
LDRRLGGLQSWSGRDGEEKNFQPLPGHLRELKGTLKEQTLNYFKMYSDIHK